jgi:hypothetical protein
MLTIIDASTQSTHGINTIVPYPFHYADLTTASAGPEEESIVDELHIQPNTDPKHFRQLFNSLQERDSV